MTFKFIVLSLLAFLLFVVYGYPPPSLLVLVGSIRFSRTISLVGSFIFGLVIDLVTGARFGSHSLFYLVTAVTTILYLRKVSGQNWRYLIISAALFAFLELFLFRRELAIWPIVLSSLFVLGSIIFVGDEAKHLVLPRL